MTMRAHLALLFLGLIASGCATTHVVHVDPPERASLEAFADAIGGRDATLELDSIGTLEASAVWLSPDSIHWWDRANQAHAVRAALFQSAERSDRGRGALEGLGLGLAATALAVIVAAICCEAEPEFWLPAEYWAGMAVGSLAIPLGSLVGLIRGHRTRVRRAPS